MVWRSGPVSEVPLPVPAVKWLQSTGGRYHFKVAGGQGVQAGWNKRSQSHVDRSVCGAVLCCDVLCCAVLRTYGLGWAGLAFTSAGLLGAKCSTIAGLKSGGGVLQHGMQERDAKLELRAGVTNKYCRRQPGRERRLATPHQARMPAKGGRSSDKADCLVCRNRELGKLEGAGHFRRKRWRRLQRQGRSFHYARVRAALGDRKEQDGREAGRQAGKAGRQPLITDAVQAGEGKGLRRPRSCLASAACQSSL